jgi:hypothetical protein
MLTYDQSSSYSKPNLRSVAKWKTLPPSTVAAAESRAADWLTKNGYELSAPVQQPGQTAKLYYKLHDRWGRMRFAQKRLTMSLWLERLIAKRIGSASWRESVRRREHEIVNRSLQ